MKNAKDIQLYHGDCLEIMKHIPDHSIDMILCDLPYGQTTRNKWDTIIPFNDYVIANGVILYENDIISACIKKNTSIKEALIWFNQNKQIGLWNQYNRILVDNGVIVLFANGMFTVDLIQSNKKMWKYNLIWEKTTVTGFLNAKKMPLRCHEDICVFYNKLPTYHPQKTTGHIRKVSKAKHKRNCVNSTNYGEHGLASYDSTERYPKSILKFATDKQKSALHPTQKPVALLEYLIKTYTNEGKTVLDNTMGSGSTGVACLHTKRKFIGIEKDKEIFEIAQKRIEEECLKEN